MNGAENTPGFVPGMDLAEGFFREEVEPILSKRFPGLRYGAGLIGSGSEVLGFDTLMSADHHWGPRVMLFLEADDHARYRGELHRVLADSLPPMFRGYPTGYTEPDPADRGVQLLVWGAAGPVSHRVETYTVGGFFETYMDIAIGEELDAADWLTLPQQKLRSIRAGGIFRDEVGIEEVRRKLAWYPHDVWLYLLASAWARIGEEEHLTGRAGHAGDETGSAIIASRLVRDVMRLGFLMERVYAPYAKWFGTAFGRLGCSKHLAPLLEAILRARSWKERDPLLGRAYEHLAGMHNALELTPPLPTSAASFFGRPFTVIFGGRFADALTAAIGDPVVKALASMRLIGGIDTMSDSTDLLEDTSRRRALKRLYR